MRIHGSRRGRSRRSTEVELRPSEPSQPKLESHYDYIIVGAGSAGCVLAHRLTEDQERPTSVLLIEAGGPDTDPRIHNPDVFESLQGTEVDWKYRTEPEPLLNDRQIPWPRGKVLGGSSSINAMIYVRGNRRDYDAWAAMGNEGWSYDDVLPYFIKSEDNQRDGIGVLHGTGGPMAVSDIDSPNPASLAFIRAAVETGYDETSDFNDREQVGGAGLYQVTIKDGKECSHNNFYKQRAIVC